MTQYIEPQKYKCSKMGYIIKRIKFIFIHIANEINTYIKYVGYDNIIYSGIYPCAGKVFSSVKISYFAPYGITIIDKYKQ